MTRAFARHLHRAQNSLKFGLARNPLSPLFSGGEGGIRTLRALSVAATYRFFIAADAKVARNAVDHCPVLPAGEVFRSGLSRLLTL
jgi:hypothetical protein